MLAVTRLKASVMRRISLAELKCASTRVFAKTLRSSADDQIIARIRGKGPKIWPFFPHFSKPIIGLAIGEKLRMKSL